MSSRAPPPGAPRFGFNRVYRTNLRPLVISFAALSALWSLFTGIGFFRGSSIDRQHSESKLSTFGIVLGAVSMAVFAIELLGVGAAARQRLQLVRLYAYLSFVALGLTIAGGVFQTVVHFTAKSDILKECTDLTNGTTFVVYPFSIGGPSFHDTISPTDAANWCNDAYDHDSWAIIVSLLFMIFLMFVFSVVAWGYYRQLLDPTSVVNFNRAPSNQFNNAYAAPSHYNPPYNASVPNLGYAAPYANPNPVYAPPPGPPPARGFDADADGKPPGYTGGADAGYGADSKDSKENPFADFDEPAAPVERDVTSRPAPGGRETFQ